MVPVHAGPAAGTGSNLPQSDQNREGTGRGDVAADWEDASALEKEV